MVDAAAIEDIYTLSPTQQGMLFQILANPGAGMYLEQMVCVLRGELAVDPFRRAWQQAIDRHPSLRAGFAWNGLSRPVQMVHRRSELAVEEHDWRDLEEADQQVRMEIFLREDRRRGFDLARPPLTRISLLRLAAERYQLVWTTYHLVLDAWCVSILLREVLAVYEGLCAGRPVRLPPSPRYRDYITWLKRQDLAPAEAYWRRTLAGFTAANPVGGTAPATAPAAGGPETGALARRQLAVSGETAAALAMLARENRLTLHTQMVGAWALLLAHTSGQDDVVFGVVASGRPPDLPGVDAMVGLFINTLPLRARVPAAPLDTSVLTWLRELGAVQAELHGCEQTPLGAVQGWSEVPRTQPLFDSLLVLFNVVDFSGAGEGSLGISYLRDITRSSYPLVVRIYPEPDLILEMLYDPRRFRPEAIDVRLGQMRTVLEEMAAAPGAPVRQIAARLLEDEKKRQELGALDRRAAAGRRLKSVVPRAVRLSNGEIR
jgi:hypothetical protein